jgi:hypothetical protein
MPLVVSSNPVRFEVVPPRDVSDDDLFELLSQRFARLRDHIAIARLVSEYIPQFDHCRVTDIPMPKRHEFLFRLARLGADNEVTPKKLSVAA